MIKNGDSLAPKLVFLTPEKIKSSNKVREFFLMLYRDNLVNRIVIDEAHCVSQWGHDFRGDYLELKKIRQLVPNVPFLALTATATKEVRIDIIKQLGMKSDTLYF